ncbi:hypothetical protein GCM10018952_32260 [Streptosporangium vulgare]
MRVERETCIERGRLAVCAVSIRGLGMVKRLLLDVVVAITRGSERGVGAAAARARRAHRVQAGGERGAYQRLHAVIPGRLRISALSRCDPLAAGQSWSPVCERYIAESAMADAARWAGGPAHTGSTKLNK